MVDISGFKERLKESKEASEAEKLRYQKYYETLYRQALRAFFVSEGAEKVLDSVYEVVEWWEERILGYLDAMGQEYWGKGNYQVCEKHEKETVRLEIADRWSIQPLSWANIFWYVHGQFHKTATNITIPIFSIDLYLLWDFDQNTLEDYWFVVTNKRSKLIPQQTDCKTVEDLEKSLERAFINGPYPHSVWHMVAL